MKSTTHQRLTTEALALAVCRRLRWARKPGTCGSRWRGKLRAEAVGGRCGWGSCGWVLPSAGKWMMTMMVVHDVNDDG